MQVSTAKEEQLINANARKPKQHFNLGFKYISPFWTVYGKLYSKPFKDTLGSPYTTSDARTYIKGFMA
jgi:hypothetical protein